VYIYTPEIHILEDRIEVYAYGIRHSNPHTTGKVKRSCVQSPSVIPYVCEKNVEVLKDLLYVLRSRGCNSVKICRNNVCREIEL